MPEGIYIPLNDRGVITIGGSDAVSFLQGLVSADVLACDESKAVWAAILTPQGKYLFDFFITKVGEILWLDCEAARLMDLGRLLHKYKLRADVQLGIAEGVHIYAIFYAEKFKVIEGCVIYDDPRLSKMGARAILKSDSTQPFNDVGLVLGDIDQYHKARIENGLPDGSKDMTPEKALLLENGFDELGGIDWNKGCYVGQELTARTKYRGLVKKRLIPVSFIGETPEMGGKITLNGKDAGEVKSTLGRVGLALVRLERLAASGNENNLLRVGETKVIPNIPAWIAGINN